MGTSVLLVSTATRWYGTARIPRTLARAGFDVSLLTPRDSLAEKSRFIARIGYLPDEATPKQWVEALGEDVLTQAGITSPREVHCKFRSSAKGQKGWTVNADCEEMGEGAPYDLAVTANEDGSLAVANEDVWGPEAVVFKLCPK